MQVRYGSETLNAPLGFFAGLVDSVVECMGTAYPELVKSRDIIHDVIECAPDAFMLQLWGAAEATWGGVLGWDVAASKTCCVATWKMCRCRAYDSLSSLTAAWGLSSHKLRRVALSFEGCYDPEGAESSSASGLRACLCRPKSPS